MSNPKHRMTTFCPRCYKPRGSIAKAKVEKEGDLYDACPDMRDCAKRIEHAIPNLQRDIVNRVNTLKALEANLAEIRRLAPPEAEVPGMKATESGILVPRKGLQ